MIMGQSGRYSAKTTHDHGRAPGTGRSACATCAGAALPHRLPPPLLNEGQSDRPLQAKRFEAK
jgi:hypothetical protein